MSFFTWKGPDFGQLLGAQLNFASCALQRLEAWCREPTQEIVDEIFRLETQADQARMDLTKALVLAFETPLDREDLDDLSRAIDDVVDQIRHMARAGAALKVKPVVHICEMVVNIQQGIKEVELAMAQLPRHLDEAQKRSKLARRPLRLNERLYSSGVAELFEGSGGEWGNDDIRNIFRQMELYRSVITLSEFLEAIADILDHAINKLA